MSAKAVSTEKLNLKFAKKAQKIERKIRKLESKLAGIALMHASINLPSKSKPKKILAIDSSDYDEEEDFVPEEDFEEEDFEEEEDLTPTDTLPADAPLNEEEEDLEEDLEEEDPLDDPESNPIPGVSVDATSVPSSVIVHVDPNEESTSVDATSAPASVIIHVDPRDIPRPETPFNSPLERRMDDLEYSVTELQRSVTSINEMFTEFFSEWKKCGRILRKPPFEKTLPSGKPNPFVYREDPSLTGGSTAETSAQQQQQEQPLTEWDMPDAERW